MENTKLIPMLVHSRSITSIESDTQENIKRSVKTEPNQFVQLWMAYNHDFKKSQIIFAKCLKKIDFSLKSC